MRNRDPLSSLKYYLIEEITLNLLLKDYLDRQITPIAAQLDTESQPLFEAFYGLGDRALLTPKLPSDSGGLGLDSLGFWQFQSLVAQHSGALAFLQTQHQSAASLLQASQNQALTQTYLPAMASGAKRVGVGFSQLRKQPAPVKAQPVSGGYQLSGTVPWVSGVGLFTEFVGAAELADGSAIFGLVPLANQKAISVSQPMALMGMAATGTVSVSLSDYFLADEQVVGTRPAGWIQLSDRTNPLSPLGLVLGCAQAGLSVAAQSLSKRQIDHPLPAQLQARIEQTWVELPKLHDLPTEDYQQKVNFRGEAISLMNTCAQTAVLAASGVANTVGHPAQRVYKEALVFSVSGQSKGSAIASLDALSIHK
ncbi:MAG: acyl-CoA dehydrogenase [Leptolyngbya foveolarum]|uniref:Acyl-CoA dehydrogenase n=1 Tax=Leptolyngbya foveolarum TaxID=47253 RepID=A0A2W4TTI0_9CYAN|nr:MAG: acyl-CoA dehydrogenase [Leptolyngbya foveolarum]